MASETVAHSILDLYLTLILVSHRLAGGSFRCRDILAEWLPFLVLSWIHNDETVRNEGARWAYVVAANTSATIDICPDFLGGFSTYHYLWEMAIQPAMDGLVGQVP
jgi:hypothetical protein